VLGSHGQPIEVCSKMIEPESESFRKAYREAGRALALYMLCFNLAKGDDAKSPTEIPATLIKYCKGFKGLSVNGNRTNWRDVAEFWRATHLILLGGCAAERIKWKIAETPSLSDTEFEKAYHATRWFWVDLDRNPSDEQIFAETLSELSEAIKKLESHWKAVDVLATTLIKKSELSAEETFQTITANIDARKLAMERKERLSRKYGTTAIPSEQVPASKTTLEREPPFIVLKSLNEAKSYEDGVVILAGDDGGQTYLVCLASQVACAEQDLELLLQDLDEIAWPGNYPDMRQIHYMTGSTDAEVASVEPWIHPMFIERGLGTVIHEVLQGKRERLR
jgi:hypothetical protein